MSEHGSRSSDRAGARIKAARVAAGMTQADLAAAVGVSRSAVAQWETERAGQVNANLARIAEVLGVSAQHLLTGDGNVEGSVSAEDGTELALLRLYRQCTPEDRQLLLRTAVRLCRIDRSSERS